MSGPGTRPLDRLLYGGSFDPLHLGHLAMMDYVLRNQITRKLEIVPARVSPFKTGAPPAPANVRLATLLAVLPEYLEPDFAGLYHVSDYEINRPPPSFSADTLRYLSELYPTETPGFLLGSDSVPGLPEWRNPEEILRKYPLVVFLRDGDTAESVRAQLFEIYKQLDLGDEGLPPRVLENDTVNVSSTEIRDLLLAYYTSLGGPGPQSETDTLAILARLGDLIPETVLSLICEEGYYTPRPEEV